MKPIKEVAIIGLGLIGGSLGLAIKKGNLAEKVIGIPRREETIGKAKDKGAIDSGTLDLKKGVAGADLVFVCTPIHLIIDKLEQIVPYLKPGAIITDVGSTKEKIVLAAEKLVPKGVFFIGGHPMAGKETTGINVAEAGLFKARPYVLTPTQKTDKKALRILEEFVLSLGGKLMKINPRTHDKAVAGISHLPIAVAAALVDTVAKQAGVAHETKECVSSGFLDTTRVASGDPVLGRDIFLSNRKQMLAFIKEFKQSLKELEELIRKEKGKEILVLLRKAKKFRDQIFDSQQR